MDRFGRAAGQLLGVGRLGEPALDVVHRAVEVVLAGRSDDAARVAADDLAHAGGDEHLRDCDPRGTQACDQDAQIGELASRQAAGVDQRRERHDGGAVLVVVEDGNVEIVDQTVFNFEAARGGDVLEVDAAEARGDRLHDCHDLVRILRVEADREGIDAGELLEEHRLALHHRHRGARPDVPETENCRAVADDGHGGARDRELEGQLRIVGDRLADACDAWGVGHREIVAGAQRMLAVLLDLPTTVEVERAVGRIGDLHAIDRADRRQNVVPVLGSARVDRDVAYDPAGGGLDEVDRADLASRVADRGRNLAEHAGAVVELDADRDAELG
ncbi:unannotated protein [freshwater metagenome]|uniref:Unannotated protein n=1 Tax=freshwater metagenome TaxID=449393 RepID=A0A6J7DW46_9ZZZZ